VCGKGVWQGVVARGCCLAALGGGELDYSEVALAPGLVQGELHVLELAEGPAQLLVGG
jgi:hypothetical protein